jgi:predicted N-acetyltransferase YhbS
MTDGPVIRTALETDVEAIAALAAELGYPSTSEVTLERLRMIDESGLLLIGADSSDKAVGFIQGQPVCVIEAGLRVEIVGLVVSSKARRGGIGQKLITKVEHWALNLGAEAVVVRSNTAPEESDLFYPATGYDLLKTQAVYEKRLIA